jgi:hypothetical protein
MTGDMFLKFLKYSRRTYLENLPPFPHGLKISNFHEGHVKGLHENLKRFVPKLEGIKNL